ncbi:MAG: hypothetical protein Q8R30_02875 [bacterium]|nr:hypothetical protein [bacterium]MDZ4285325.1 hypothetical protein [Candidatus Sungbacteria bacterium]
MASRGCYSIIYIVDDPVDRGLIFSMDYSATHQAGALGGQWICSDNEVGMIHWIPRRMIPKHGSQALLDHFGLTEEDMVGCGMFFLLDQSPATLVRTRRAKEHRENLPYKEVRNMRLGCDPSELLPDVFEAAA